MKRLSYFILASLLYLGGCSEDNMVYIDSTYGAGSGRQSNDHGSEGTVGIPGTQQDGTNPGNPSVDPSNPAPADPVDGQSPDYQADPTDPGDPTVPVTPPGTGDPTDPGVPVDPSDPTVPGVPTDPIDPNACELSSCGGLDVCLRNDKNNCGSCGHACQGAEAYCADGQCMNECGGDVCSGVCVDTSTDHENCGQCGHACNGDEACSAGVCTPQCGGTMCGTECVTDFNSNAAHCGQCGNVCGNGLVCSDGSCVCPDASQSQCNGVCVDIMTDINHCGACNSPCSTSCNNGVCAAADNDQFVVDIARKYLFDVTGKCTYDLRDVIPYFVDYSSQGASFNYGYDKNCASFVGSILKEAGILPAKGSYQALSHFRNLCEKTHDYGYHVVSNPSDAKPGDIWYSSTHVEIVVEPDDSKQKHKLIGSNNYDSKDKVQCLQNHSTNSKYSSDPTDYQRVTEQYRNYGKGTICSRH